MKKKNSIATSTISESNLKVHVSFSKFNQDEMRMKTIEPQLRQKHEKDLQYKAKALLANELSIYRAAEKKQMIQQQQLDLKQALQLSRAQNSKSNISGKIEGKAGKPQPATTRNKSTKRKIKFIDEEE